MTTVITRDFSTSYTKSTIGTNVSTCKFWLPADENGGSIITLTDAIDSKTVTIPSSSGDGTKVTIPNTAAAALSANIAAPAADFAVLCAANLNSAIANIQFGTGNNAASDAVQIGNGGSTLYSGTDTIALDAVTNNQTQKFLITFDNTGNAYLWEGQTGTKLDNTLKPATSNLNTLAQGFNTQMAFNATSGSAQTLLYGFAYFDFPNGIPHDFYLWGDWMLEKWISGSKVIPAAAANW